MPVTPAELARRIEIAKSMLDFYRCPYNGRLIEANKGDDKVICKCPRVAKTGGTHYVKGLVAGDAKEYVLKIEAERKERS